MTAADLARRADECRQQLLDHAAAEGVGERTIAVLTFVGVGGDDAPDLPLTITPGAAEFHWPPADASAGARRVAEAGFVGRAVGRLHELFAVAAAAPAYLLKLNGLNPDLDPERLAPLSVGSVVLEIGTLC